MPTAETLHNLAHDVRHTSTTPRSERAVRRGRLGIGPGNSTRAARRPEDAAALVFRGGGGVASLRAGPVMMLTTSTEALRIYLALLAGCGPFLALWVWRRLLPAPVLAVAGALFASLWVTMFYGPQAMPNLWVAYGVLT